MGVLCHCHTAHRLHGPSHLKHASGCRRAAERYPRCHSGTTHYLVLHTQTTSSQPGHECNPLSSSTAAGKDSCPFASIQRQVQRGPAPTFPPVLGPAQKPCSHPRWFTVRCREGVHSPKIDMHASGLSVCPFTSPRYKPKCPGWLWPIILALMNNWCLDLLFGDCEGLHGVHIVQA